MGYASTVENSGNSLEIDFRDWCLLKRDGNGLFPKSRFPEEAGAEETGGAGEEDVRLVGW